jgi:hypothetical protein
MIITFRFVRIIAHACAFAFAMFACGCSDDASKPASTSETSAPALEKPKAPLLTKPVIADWCKEHGVPESICTRCNDSLIAGFKAKGDWCTAHALPESQCIACHPELEAKFKAMAPPTEGR